MLGLGPGLRLGLGIVIRVRIEVVENSERIANLPTHNSASKGNSASQRVCW